MASNGRVANAAKTVFMILNRTRAEINIKKFNSIEVDGVTIKVSAHTKLLGMEIQENQGWNEHFKGKNGLISSLEKKNLCY